MVNSSDIQLAYIDLYKQIRKYVWDIDSVELIAKIEDEANKSFPDIGNLNHLLDHLKQISKENELDKELLDSIDKFKNILVDVNSDDIYTSIISFKEIVQWRLQKMIK